jgi:transcriptional regulator with XRE-family HTH domain
MLAIRIMQLRKLSGMTQLQLAQILHISASAEGMYEQGRRTPSLEILIMMSQLFGVSLDYLITGSEFTQTKNGARKDHGSTMCPCCVCSCRKENR